MGICPDQPICRDERTIEQPRRCDDELVRRITMERPRQSSGFDGHLRGKGNQLNRGYEGLGQPEFDRAGQLEPSQLNQLGHLPARNGADAQPFPLVGLDVIQAIRGKLRPPFTHQIQMCVSRTITRERSSPDRQPARWDRRNE